MANDQGTYLGYLNYVEDAGTTFATDLNAFGDRVLSNVANRQSDDSWRVGGLTAEAYGVQATITLAAAKAIRVGTIQFPRGVYPGVSEVAPNFATTDTIRWRLYDASDTLLYDSTATAAADVLPGYMLHVKDFGQAYTAKKIVLDFSAPSRGTATFFDVGAIGVWPIIEPNVGFSYPAGFGWILNTENQKTIAGRTYTARFEPKRRWSLVFDYLTNDESMVIDEMVRYSGGARQVLVRRGDLPTGKNAMLAIVTPSRDIEARTASLRQLSLAFEEFI